MKNHRYKAENKQTVLFMNKDRTRKEQIINWTEEVLREENLYRGINTEEDFKDAIDTIIDYNSDNLGYILENNFEEFGKENTLNFLKRGLFGNRLRKEEQEEKQEHRETKQNYKISKVRTTIVKPKKKFFYGYEKGKKVKANYTIEFSKTGKEFKQYRSLKTGHIVSHKRKK